MINKDYYNYYEILFSLRKEYLKNQKVLNKLLSYIKITNDFSNEYNSSLIFKTNSKNNIDSLLLVIKKRQFYIELMLDSLYDSLVYCSPDSKAGCFSYTFRLSGDYTYLLEDNQDGRYLKAKVEISNQKAFIDLYKQLIENLLCKHGKTYIDLNNASIQLSNNGIHLFYMENDDYKNYVKMDYNGIEDNIITNNSSYLGKLMKLKINKNIVPNYFEKIINHNMDDYLYTIDGNDNKDMGFYTIEDYGKKLVLKQKNNKKHILK